MSVKRSPQQQEIDSQTEGFLLEDALKTRVTTEDFPAWAKKRGVLESSLGSLRERYVVLHRQIFGRGKKTKSPHEQAGAAGKDVPRNALRSMDANAIIALIEEQPWRIPSVDGLKAPQPLEALRLVLRKLASDQSYPQQCCIAEDAVRAERERLVWRLSPAGAAGLTPLAETVCREKLSVIELREAIWRQATGAGPTWKALEGALLQAAYQLHSQVEEERRFRKRFEARMNEEVRCARCRRKAIRRELRTKHEFCKIQLTQNNYLDRGGRFLQGGASGLGRR